MTSSVVTLTLTEFWDTYVKPDDRGEEVVEWALENDLVVLNDGEPTRIDRYTGKESVPDITVVGSDLATKCSWSVAQAIGNSDHLPIIITLHVKVPHETILGAVSRWRTNGVDWKVF